ncbi:Conserved_hypothetical protein [Hexamita inflata]|uniref:Uncharacterized protein n=1 Tax=Hexamita inflata TaxID=28002 RepID=A0AA86UTT6_9EUKA|nr:Conserved hypothetical protein [Hexamita inflata]
MLSSITLIFQQLSFQKHATCLNSLVVNKNLYNFCQKANFLNKINLRNNLYLSQKSSNVHLFIQTEATKQASIDVNVNNVDVNVFALFGFNINSQTISDSSINVTLQFEVISGALVCITCDIHVLTSTLVFIASGQQISGLILETLLKVHLYQSFVQYRITSQRSSGLVNVIGQEQVNFSINNCKLSGYDFLTSDSNGYIASSIQVNFTVTIDQFIVCVDSIKVFGLNEMTISVVGSETLNCDICEQSNIAYGLCVDSLENSQIDGGMFRCVFPFEYIHNTCLCASGYLLNITECINLLSALANINIQTQTNIDQIETIQKHVQELQNNVSQLELSLVSQINSAVSEIGINLTLLEDYVVSNSSYAEANLLSNVSALDKMIFENISILSLTLTNNVSYLSSQISGLSSNLMQNSTNLENYILSNYSKAEGSLLLNTSVLDQRIFNNVTALSSQLTGDVSSLQSQINVLNSNLVANSSNLENYILSNYSKAEANTLSSASVLDNRIYNNVTLLSSTIANGVSQLNLQISSLNSNLIANSTNLENYIMSNYSKADQNLMTNTSVLDQRIFNNATFLANNIATISFNLEQNIISNFSKADANLFANTSVLDRRIYDNITTLNSSITVNSNALQLTISSLNSSVLSLNQYVVKQSVYIQKLKRQIQCLTSGNLVDNDTCKYYRQINYQDDTEMCSQPVFATIFDFDAITIQIQQTDISGGFVFTTIINDALINVQDNSYSSTIQPLFQTQNSFKNIKLQVGTQSINNGVMFANGNTVTINEVNIVSRTGTQITVTGELDVILASSSNAQICNLLLNLSFTMSTGNITLISSVVGTANITTYQIMGEYLSSGTVAMMSLNVNSAIIILQQFNFMPNQFNIGNCSSYLMSQVIASNISMSYLAVQLNNLQILSQIETKQVYDEIEDNIYYYYFQFGGIINKIVDTIIDIHDIILNTQQIINIKFICKFGTIIGQGLNKNIINIRNQCIRQILKSNLAQYSIVGLIGQYNGDIQIQQSFIIIEIYGVSLSYFGTISQVGNGQIQLQNITIQYNPIVIQYGGQHSSAIISQLQSQICIVQNVIVFKSNFSINQQVGGFIGYICNTNVNIQNSEIDNSIILNQAQCGAIIGQSYYNIVYMENISIININITGIQTGGCIGNFYGVKIQIYNSIVNNMKNNAQEYAGGFVGVSQDDGQQINRTMILKNLVISNTAIGAQYAGGFFGCSFYTNIQIQNSKILSVSIKGTTQYSLIGFQSIQTTLIIVNSKSQGENYINDVLQTNCSNLTNLNSVNQC